MELISQLVFLENLDFHLLNFPWFLQFGIMPRIDTKGKTSVVTLASRIFNLLVCYTFVAGKCPSIQQVASSTVCLFFYPPMKCGCHLKGVSPLFTLHFCWHMLALFSPTAWDVNGVYDLERTGAERQRDTAGLAGSSARHGWTCHVSCRQTPNTGWFCLKKLLLSPGVMGLF